MQYNQRKYREVVQSPLGQIGPIFSRIAWGQELCCIVYHIEPASDASRKIPAGIPREIFTDSFPGIYSYSRGNRGNGSD